MEESRTVEHSNPYKEIRLRTHLAWVAIVTIANHIPAETTLSKFIRSYLAMVVWLLIILNKNRILIQRAAILIVYLEFNTIGRIIENLSYSIMIIKVGMFCVSIEQVISYNVSETIRNITLIYLIMLVICLPDSKKVEQKLIKGINRYLQQWMEKS
jgi:hypothetical protein